MLDFFPRLLTIILTLFFLMICGYICRKTKIIDDKASKALSRLIVSIGQPMMIIGALNNIKFSKENFQQALKDGDTTVDDLLAPYKPKTKETNEQDINPAQDLFNLQEEK